MSTTRMFDRWSELSELVEKAADLPINEIDAFCVDACGDDRELFQLLKKLLTHAIDSDHQISDSIANLANDIADSNDITGRLLGPYKIERLLGRGGMGEVYLASRADGEFEKKVAIKIIRDRLTHVMAGEMFQNERQTLANLNHPSIPTLVDAGQTEDGRPYFVCDYVVGTSIAEHCEHQQLGTTERLDLLRQIGETVQHAHNNMVLHLDIKPDNILVQKNGQPSLLDFGVARMMDQGGDGRHAYSPGYASPEQIRNERLSASSDVYSLGAVMFYILSGDKPFETLQDAPTETVLGQRSQFIARLDSISNLQEIPKDLRAIIRKAMAEQSTDRYSTVDAFLRDLRDFQLDLPVSARNKTIGYRLLKSLRRNRVAAALVTIAFAALTMFGLREADLRQQAVASQLETEAAYKKVEVEATTAQQVSSFLVRLFNLADPGETNGNSVTARDLLDQGAATIEQDLADQPTIASRLMQTMGSAYHGLGLHQQQNIVLEKALDFYESGSTGDEMELAELLNDLGTTYRRISKLEEAESAHRRALAIYQEQLGEDSVEFAHALGGLFKVLDRQGRHKEAEQIAYRRIEIYKRSLGKDDGEYGHAIWNLGQLFSSMGRLKEAEQHYLTALPILEKAWGSESISLGYMYQNLANLYGRLRKLGQAEEALRHSIALTTPTFGDDHPRVASAQMSLGMVLVLQDKPDEAETTLIKAISTLEKSYGSDNARVGVTRANLSEAYRMNGLLQLAEQEGLLALKILEATHRPGLHFVGYCYRALGRIYRDLGDNEKASHYFKSAVANLSDLPNDDIERREIIKEYAEFLRSIGRDTPADAVLESITPTK